MNQHAWLVAMLALGITTLPVGASHIEGPRPRLLAPAPVAREARAECADLALKVALSKARAETRELRAGASPESLFGTTELIKAEYTRRAGCVVTVTLPLERIRRLSAL